MLPYLLSFIHSKKKNKKKKRKKKKKKNSRNNPLPNPQIHHSITHLDHLTRNILSQNSRILRPFQILIFLHHPINRINRHVKYFDHDVARGSFGIRGFGDGEGSGLRLEGPGGEVFEGEGVPASCGGVELGGAGWFDGLWGLVGRFF